MTGSPRKHMKLLIEREDGTRMKIALSELQSTHISSFLYFNKKGGKHRWARFKVKLLK